MMMKHNRNDSYTDPKFAKGAKISELLPISNGFLYFSLPLMISSYLRPNNFIPITEYMEITNKMTSNNKNPICDTWEIVRDTTWNDLKYCRGLRIRMVRSGITIVSTDEKEDLTNTSGIVITTRTTSNTFQGLLYVFTPNASVLQEICRNSKTVVTLFMTCRKIHP
eukprot:Tbor_TRINITY_DN1604_c0_g1::TRINITY_DN1604_c0_g1_i1::g.7585::m.7585